MTFSEFAYFLLAGRAFILTKISPYFPTIKGIFLSVSILLFVLVIYLETKVNFFRGRFFYYLELLGIDTKKIIFRRKIKELFNDLYDKITVREEFKKFLEETNQFLDDLLKYKRFKGMNLEERISDYSPRLLSAYRFFLNENNFSEKTGFFSELLVYRVYLEKLALEESITIN